MLQTFVDCNGIIQRKSYFPVFEIIFFQSKIIEYQHLVEISKI